MSSDKAVSVTQDGQPDGFEVQTGWFRQIFPGGQTRLTVTAPAARLPEVHGALVGALRGPLGVLYRQRVDRRNPVEGAPERDFVGLELTPARVATAIERCRRLVYQDARHELWIRDRDEASVVLDGDGIIYVYPDDPSFRDALAAAGVREDEQLVTMLDRDYVMHRFFAELDEEEDALMALLGLVPVGG
jgi:hypothetical protein